MRAPRYTPRHGGSRTKNPGASLRGLVRRPVVGGALAVAMLGSVGATVAIGDPSHTPDQPAAASSPAPGTVAAADVTQADTARVAQDRRTTNISRSASREKDRLARVDARKKAAAAAERKAAATKRAAKQQRAQEKAKPVTERDFTDAEVKIIQKDPAPYAREMLSEYGWGQGEWSCLISLWSGESDWTWNATNSSSGAYGIPQSLPASKMASAGPDWKTNPITQMKWGMTYIKDSYGSPCGAKSFWDSKNPHWY